MAIIVNIHQAKTNFLKLVDAAAQGDEIIIAKAGKPIAKLVPITLLKSKRKPGRLKGKIHISADFDESMPENLLQQFEGK